VTWPALPYAEWKDTLASLHMWTQIVGKIRMELSPWVNHSWSVPLYVSSRGLTTSTIPYGDRAFQIDFDFVAHRLWLAATDGTLSSLELRPQTVSQFYSDVNGILADCGIDVTIHPVPNEVPDPIPFPDDTEHSAYDPDRAHDFWLALLQIDRVFSEFRARFLGKVSPVHFFWGACDLAVTRFSGRRAPEHPGGIPNLPDEITREAYSHEVSSCGFWPGNDDAPDPIFYSYAYPTPDGFAEAGVRPDAAFWLAELGEFVLPYEVVRTSGSPDDTLTDFLESTYAAAADLANWDREGLELPRGFRPLPRAG
jgi:hypothetical protein